MRLLVLGRSGQLASSLAEHPMPPGSTVKAAGRPECDLGDAASIAAAMDRFSPTIVVNAAAYNAVDRAEIETAEAFAVNGEAPGRIAALCAERKIPLVHVSTDYVFDGEKGSPYVEDDPTRPLNAYARSKRAGEVAVAESLREHVILRTAWVHSPFGSNFVKTMLTLSQTKPVIRVVSDQRGSPTYAPHLAAAIVMIAGSIGRGKSPTEPWGIYHAVGSGETSWYGFASEVFQQAAHFGWRHPQLEPVKAADFAGRGPRPADSRLDTGKLRRTFGVSLPDWKLGVFDCVQRLANVEGRASTPLSRHPAANAGSAA